MPTSGPHHKPHSLAKRGNVLDDLELPSANATWSKYGVSATCPLNLKLHDSIVVHTATIVTHTYNTLLRPICKCPQTSDRAGIPKAPKWRRPYTTEAPTNAITRMNTILYQHSLSTACRTPPLKRNPPPRTDQRCSTDVLPHIKLRLTTELRSKNIPTKRRNKNKRNTLN